MGNQNAEKVMQFGQHGQSMEGQIAEREAMFKHMNAQWKGSCKHSSKIESEMMAMQREMQMMMSSEHEKARH